MSIIQFTRAKLPSGKKGTYTQDKNGYYCDLIVGGLNVYNSNNQYYTLEEAKNLFETSSTFMRRVEKGVVKGEVGHPVKQPGWSMNDWIERIIDIDERNVCCHFRSFTLNYEIGEKLLGKGSVAIITDVAPSGPYGDVFKRSMDNPDENVFFSLRALTNDFYRNGVYIKVIKNLVTFDMVNEGGISIAQKTLSPGMESNTSKEYPPDITVTANDFRRIINKKTTSVSQENSKILAREMLESIEPTTSNRNPIFTKWV